MLGLSVQIDRAIEEEEEAKLAVFEARVSASYCARVADFGAPSRIFFAWHLVIYFLTHTDELQKDNNVRVNKICQSSQTLSWCLGMLRNDKAA